MKHAKVPIIFALCFWPLAEVLSGVLDTQSGFGSLNNGNDFRIMIGAGSTVCFKPKTVSPKSDPDISVVKFRLIRVEESFAVKRSGFILCAFFRGDEFKWTLREHFHS